MTSPIVCLIEFVRPEDKRAIWINPVQITHVEERPDGDSCLIYLHGSMVVVQGNVETVTDVITGEA